MKKVFVTPRSITKNGHPSLKKLEKAGFEIIFATPGKQPTEEEQMKILPECVAYLAGIEPIRAKILEAAKNLKVISRNGVGIENIDLNAAKRLGIQVKITPGANSQGVAELTIALMLSAVRSIPSCSDHIKKGEWKREKGIEINEKTLGIIGCGNIGRRVANMALGLSMKVLAYDLFPDISYKPSKDFTYTSIEHVFQKADIISLHCPPGEKPLINDNTLKVMKDGVFIINTARAEVIDEKAMVQALNSGKVRIYATDVYEIEPPDVDDLISHEHTITTPHLGGNTIESIDRATEAAVDNILKILKVNSIFFNKSRIDSVEVFLKSYPEDSIDLKLIWLGQAGFLLGYKGFNLIIDPYLSDFLSKKYKGKIFPHIRLMDPPIIPEKIINVDYILSSHPHSDHLDPETVSVISKNIYDCKFVVPRAAIDEAIKSGIIKEQLVPINAEDIIKITEEIQIKAIPSAHENFKINEKGEHHFLGYIFQFGNLKVYHSGDCIPYEGLDKKIIENDVDVALLPINGRDEYRLNNGIAGNFKIHEVLELCQQADIKILIVHHFGMFAYNTVSNEDLHKIASRNSQELQIVVPEVNVLYKIIKI